MNVVRLLSLWIRERERRISVDDSNREAHNSDNGHACVDLVRGEVLEVDGVDQRPQDSAWSK